MMKFRPVLLFILMFFIINAFAKDATNELLRKSVSFSYLLGDGFLGHLSQTPTNETFNDIRNMVKSIRSERNDGGIIPLMKPVLLKVVWSYVGFVVLIIFGLLFIILMPIVGFIFACCRCCGRCGGRVELMDRKADPCRRVFYTIVLVVITTLQLAALVVAFINHYLTNQALVHKDDNMFRAINHGLDSLKGSLNEAVLQASNTDTTGDLTNEKIAFNSVLGMAVDDFKHDFRNDSGAQRFLTPTYEFVKITQEFSPNSEKVKVLNSFLSGVELLIREIDEIKSSLLVNLDDVCLADEITQCQSIRNEADTNLRVAYSTESFQISTIRQDLSSIESNRLAMEELDEFNKMWNNLDVKKSIQPKLDRAWNDLSNNGEKRNKLAKLFKSVVGVVNTAIEMVSKFLRFDGDFSVYYENIKSGESLRFYVGAGVLCIPLLIVVFLYLGLCFGTCGSRPYDDAGVCNKGVGANLLMAAVAFIFLFSFMLMLLCLLAFSTSGLIQSEFCGTLKGTKADTRLLDYLFQMVVSEGQMAASVDTDDKESLGKWLIGLTPVETLWHRCKDESFVNALGGGHQSLPIDEEIEEGLQTILTEIKLVDLATPIEKSVIKLQESYKKLTRFSKLSYTAALGQLDRPLTKIVDLKEFIKKIEKLRKPPLADIVTRLRNEVLAYDQQRMEIRQILISLSVLSARWEEASRELRTFKENVVDAVDRSLNKGLEGLRPKFRAQLRLAVLSMWQPIKCDKVYESAHRTTDGFCGVFLQPFNGVWYGLGFCVILYIPTLIFALLLISLYRKTEAYSTDYEETNYLSYQPYYINSSNDTGANSSGKSKKRSKKGNHQNKSHQSGFIGYPSHMQSGGQGYQPVSVYPYDAYE